MVSLFRVASFTGLLIAATTLHGCGGSGGSPSSPGTDASYVSMMLPANHGVLAGMFTVAPGGSAEHGNVVVSCPAGGPACMVTVAADGTASYDRTGGVPGVEAAYGSWTLPSGHGLMAGTITVAPGGSAEHGNVVVSCPAGGPVCMVNVAADGTASYDRTGGVPGVMAAYAPWSLPANHGLAEGMFTVASGGSVEHGNVLVSCPAGGSACVVNVAADGTAGYDRTGGVPGVMAVPVTSMLTDAYDIVPDSGYEVLPPNAGHLISDIAAAQTYAGGTELVHSRGRYTYGANRILTEANTLIAGPRVGHWDRRLPEFSCMGRVCASNPPDGYFELYVDNYGLIPNRHSNVLQKNGIGLLQWTWDSDWEIPDRYGYSHQEGFVLLSDVAVGNTYWENGGSFSKADDSGGDYFLYSHEVFGFAGGMNPAGDATYRGLMLGSVVEKDDTKDLNEPNWVIGDAVFQFDLAASELDATFSNVVGLVSGQTYGNLAWAGISVSDGAFKQVVVAGENYIDGALFGANQEGTAGVFEQNSIFGMFSAVDPQADVETGLTEVDNPALEDLAQARSAASGMAPDFTVEEYTTAAQGIFDNADEFIAGMRIVSWGDRRLHDNFNCEGRACRYDAPPGGISYEVNLDDLMARPESHEAVMRKNGIAVAQFGQGSEWNAEGQNGYELRFGLGLWGEENVVWTEFGQGYSPGWYGTFENWVAGSSSGTTPTGDATYTGAMAGSVVETDPTVPPNTPDWVMGDAELTFSLADNSLDATFSNIVSLESGTSHNDLSWEDVPVVHSDRFATDEPGNYLIGEFFGASHEGVGGTFMQDSIAGVFTARQ